MSKAAKARYQSTGDVEAFYAANPGARPADSTARKTLMIIGCVLGGIILAAGIILMWIS